MKKQILLIIVSAFFVGTMAFGQALPGTLTRGVNCTPNALTPIAGNSYDYSATANPTGGNFLFWATTDPNFISTTLGATTTNILDSLQRPTDLTAATNYGVSSTTGTVSITWSDATLATATAGTPTFVAVYYTAPALGCADNFNAWEIQPINAFIVDILNIKDDTRTVQPYDSTASQCVDQVRGATYNGGTINYNFGADTLYFEVVAANFTVSWTPTFEVLGLDIVEASDIVWTYSPPANWGTATWNAPGVVSTAATNTSTGVSIYVRVTVTHNNYEGLTNRYITLSVDGQNSVNLWDIANNTLTDLGPLCPTVVSAADKFDIASQTLKLRPALTTLPTTPFITGDQKN